MKSRININSIAKRSGVSTTTVSNLINGTEKIPISVAKRERIMEVMRAANYRPSCASSQLRRQQHLSGCAVFIFGSHPVLNAFGVVRNPMLGELIARLDRDLRAGFGLALEPRAVADEDSLRSWNETIADAEAVLYYGQINAKLLELTQRRNIPLVVIAETATPVTRGVLAAPLLVDYVYWNAASHLETMLEHVRARGARRLVFVSSWNIERNRKIGFAVEAEAKIAKFTEYIAAHPEMTGQLFCPPVPDNADPYYEGRNAYDAIRGEGALLASADTMVGHNDFVAQGVIAALRDQGLIPGREVKVTGEGDYPECRHLVPAVTTITYDRQSLSTAVCGILKRKLADNRTLGERIPVASHILVRETA